MIFRELWIDIPYMNMNSQTTTVKNKDFDRNYEKQLMFMSVNVYTTQYMLH